VVLGTLGFGFWSFRLFFFFGGTFEVEGEEAFEDLVVGEVGRPAVSAAQHQSGRVISIFQR
jgi:1-acyl-sn-glycerol-3-phosphate acyltransferase